MFGWGGGKGLAMCPKCICPSGQRGITRKSGIPSSSRAMQDCLLLVIGNVLHFHKDSENALKYHSIQFLVSLSRYGHYHFEELFYHFYVINVVFHESQ